MNSVMLASAVLSVVEVVIVPSYALKSLTKFILFLGIPLSYAAAFRDQTYKKTLKGNKKAWKTAFTLGLAVFGIIMAAFYVFSQFVDLSSIGVGHDEVEDPSGINPQNFVYVSVYISFINSFLEEFFFRGFAFATLRRYINPKSASLFSALLFALYHVSLLITWLPMWATIGTTAVLFATGLVFNKLYDQTDSLFTTYFVHMAANIGINTVTYFIYC